MEGRVGFGSLRVVDWEGADWSRTGVSGSRGSSRRGGSGRDLDEEESLALLLFGACVSDFWSTVLKKPEDDTTLGSWVAGGIPGIPSGDNGDDISTVGRGLASFGGEVSIAGLSRVGAGMSIFPVDGGRPTCRDKGKHAPV